MFHHRGFLKLLIWKAEPFTHSKHLKGCRPIADTRPSPSHEEYGSGQPPVGRGQWPFQGRRTTYTSRFVGRANDTKKTLAPGSPHNKKLKTSPKTRGRPTCCPACQVVLWAKYVKMRPKKKCPAWHIEWWPPAPHVLRTQSLARASSLSTYPTMVPQ